MGTVSLGRRRVHLTLAAEVVAWIVLGLLIASVWSCSPAKAAGCVSDYRNLPASHGWRHYRVVGGRHCWFVGNGHHRDRVVAVHRAYRWSRPAAPPTPLPRPAPPSIIDDAPPPTPAPPTMTASALAMVIVDGPARRVDQTFLTFNERDLFGRELPDPIPLPPAARAMPPILAADTNAPPLVIHPADEPPKLTRVGALVMVVASFAGIVTVIALWPALAGPRMIDITANRRNALRWIAAREPVDRFPSSPSLYMVKGLEADGYVEAMKAPGPWCLTPFRLTAMGHSAKLFRVGVVMSPPMVIALLDGRKTMTRRLVEPSAGPGSMWTRLESGDLLWVREAYSDDGVTFSYMADEGPRPPTGWKSGRYMPRAASRLTLRVTAPPRVEPVQRITAADARAEGFEDRAAFVRLWKVLHKLEGWRDNPSVAVVSFEVIRANIDAVA